MVLIRRTRTHSSVSALDSSICFLIATNRVKITWYVDEYVTNFQFDLNIILARTWISAKRAWTGQDVLFLIKLVRSWTHRGNVQFKQISPNIVRSKIPVLDLALRWVYGVHLENWTVYSHQSCPQLDQSGWDQEEVILQLRIGLEEEDQDKRIHLDSKVRISESPIRNKTFRNLISTDRVTRDGMSIQRNLKILFSIWDSIHRDSICTFSVWENKSIFKYF